MVWSELPSLPEIWSGSEDGDNQAGGEFGTFSQIDTEGAGYKPEYLLGLVSEVSGAWLRRSGRFIPEAEAVLEPDPQKRER